MFETDYMDDSGNLGVLDYIDRIADIGSRTYAQVNGAPSIYRTTAGTTFAGGSLLIPLALVAVVFLLVRR